MKRCILFWLVLAGIVWGEELTEVQNNYLYSYQYEANGDYENSLRCMLTILKSSPEDYFGNLRVGWLYYLADQYSTSIFYYQNAVSLKPGAVEPKIGLLMPFIASQNFQEAKTVALSILKADKLNYSANSKLAYCYFCLKEYNQAEKYYKKIINLYPGDLEMKAGLAWTYLKQGKNNEAKKLFNDILAQSPYHNSSLSGLNLLDKKNQ